MSRFWTLSIVLAKDESGGCHCLVYCIGVTDDTRRLSKRRGDGELFDHHVTARACRVFLLAAVTSCFVYLLSRPHCSSQGLCYILASDYSSTISYFPYLRSCIASEQNPRGLYQSLQQRACLHQEANAHERTRLLQWLGDR